LRIVAAAVLTAVLFASEPASARAAVVATPPAAIAATNVAREGDAKAAKQPAVEEAAIQALAGMTAGVNIILSAMLGLIAMMAIVPTLLALGLYTRMRTAIRSEINERVNLAVRRQVSDFIEAEWVRTNELQAALNEATASLAASRLALFSRDMLADITADGRRITRASLGEFLKSAADMVTLPTRLSVDIGQVAVKSRSAVRSIESIRTLWADVKAGHVQARPMRRVVLCLIEIVRARGAAPRDLEALELFAAQLERLIDNSEPLPKEPGF
jgi:hypothetical protein